MSPQAHSGKSPPLGSECAAIVSTRFSGGPVAPGAHPLQQHRLIGQFVVAAARAGEMSSKERPDPENSDHRAVAETSLAIVVLHLAAYRIPLGLRNPQCYTAVGDDLDS